MGASSALGADRGAVQAGEIGSSASRSCRLLDLRGRAGDADAAVSRVPACGIANASELLEG
jgi:hypothetical protein